jgi:hypothetical protein
MTAWVTGPQILTHVRITAPTPDETAWAAACALAVSAGIDRFLGWTDAPVQPYVPPAGASDEVTANALTTGAEAFARKSAPFGVTSYQDLQGAAIRVARDYLEGIRPQLERWRYVAGSIA